jgi:hypothetical protein
MDSNLKRCWPDLSFLITQCLMDVLKLGCTAIYIINNVRLSLLGPAEPAQLWVTYMMTVNIHCHKNLRSNSRFVFKGYLVRMLGYCLSSVRWFVGLFSLYRDIILQYAVTRSFQIIAYSPFIIIHVWGCILCSLQVIVEQPRNQFQRSYLQFHHLYYYYSVQNNQVVWIVGHHTSSESTRVNQ